MVSYETLWGMPDVSEKTLTGMFQRVNSELPSDVLSILKDEDFFRGPQLDDLAESVSAYLQKLSGFSVAVAGTYAFPDRLLEAPSAPHLFYYKGNLKLLDRRCVSVVGSRKASAKGRERAALVAAGLVREGFVVISGLASGIDTSAMTAAIEADGHTVGVIGTPLDVCYPRGNEALQDTVSKEHLLISQVPFYRYANEPFEDKRRYFPARNVTMAALSEATIIIEAGETSGTLTQARSCLQLGRKLLIMDTCFENPDISWPSKYVQNGAVRVESIEDALQALETDRS